MGLVFEFGFLLISNLLLPLLAGYGNGNLVECPRSFFCGKLGSIQFPFTTPEHPDCGLLVVHHCDDPSFSTSIELENNGKPRFLELTGVFAQQNMITAFDPDLLSALNFPANDVSCEVFNKNITILANSPLISFYIKDNVTLFICNRSLFIPPFTESYYWDHYVSCNDYGIFYDPPPKLESNFSRCSTLVLPKDERSNSTYPFTLLSPQITFMMRLSDACDKCYNHEGGLCQLDNHNNFYCFRAPLGQNKSKIFKVILGMGLALSIGAIMLLSLAYYFRGKLFVIIFSFLGTRNHPTHQRIENFLKDFGPLPSKRYSYSDIQKITNNFKIKLGQGGCGNVYKGILKDGRLVAVKVLSELKGTGEEFINEVASNSKTSHVNIVNLLGFCLQGSKRALVYEFMPNGSLEKFIFEANETMVDLLLDCKTLLNIAIGVARGLEYLHKGCNTRILHFDIKPHNILLDEDFCPKISDFGLAKVCPRKESIVSLLGARGTAGYIAPEIFSRNFGGVSHKSDVYSYGMMVFEMVGGRRNINVQIDRSNEIYFPHWIYKRIELNEELGLRCIKDDCDMEIIRKMIIVSLCCIQTNPLTRPAISKVVEMLEGGLESLQVPPKP